MELSFISNKAWKLCIIASLFCCLNVSFSTAKNTNLEFDLLGEAETPISGIVSTHLKPSNVSSFTSPPIASLINETLNFSYFTSDMNNNQPKSTQNIHIAKPYVPIRKLGKQTNNMMEKKCNIFDGKWVYSSEAKRSYDGQTCPFLEDKFNCRKSGRPDLGYEKWRWEAKDCKIPLFNGKDMLERLRNKRVIIVGDSLNRNMWGSLSCLLYSSVSSSRFEVYANDTHYKMLKAKDYNTIVEFHWSPFLVELDTSHKSGKTVLVLDKLSANSDLWRGADVMVFNSADWWTHSGKLKKWDLLQYKGQLYEDMPMRLAYKRGMKTWENWINKNVDPKRTTVLFRSVAPVHNAGKGCYNASHPIMDKSFKYMFPKSLNNAIEDVIKGMTKLQVKYLNVTTLSGHRIDSHPSVYRDNWRWKLYTTKYKRLIRSYADCSHWCLPGLPDTWSQLLYASLFFEKSRNE